MLLVSTIGMNLHADHVSKQGKSTLCGKLLGEFWWERKTPLSLADLTANRKMCKACLAVIRKSERPKFVQVPYKKKAFRVPVAFNKEATDAIKTLLKEYRRRCRTGL